MFNFSWIEKKDGDDIYAEHVNSLADGIKETQEAVENISIDIDTEMSDTSTNAVQNKVVKTYVDDIVSDVVEGVETAIVNKADKATTLYGYGIADAYTKTEIDAQVGDIETALDNIISIQNNLMGVSE